MTSTGLKMLERLGAVSNRHPRSAECEGVVKAWLAANSGLGGRISEAKYEAWKFATLGSLMYPRCNVETVTLAACFTHWIAVVDDAVEASPERTAEFRQLHEVESTDGEWGPVVSAWQDVQQRLTYETSDAFRERVRNALGRLFDAYAWEAQVRNERRLPTLDELVVYRHASGGLPLYLLILERGVGGPLDAGIVTEPWFEELSTLAGNLTCFANDLLSFEWDRESDNPINLVRVLGRGSEPNVELVHDYFVEEWQRLHALIEAARGRVTRGSAADRYLGELPPLVTGVFTWMDETRRYAKP
jgi:hypothetical protein